MSHDDEHYIAHDLEVLFAQDIANEIAEELTLEADPATHEASDSTCNNSIIRHLYEEFEEGSEGSFAAAASEMFQIGHTDIHNNDIQAFKANTLADMDKDVGVTPAIAQGMQITVNDNTNISMGKGNVSSAMAMEEVEREILYASAKMTDMHSEVVQEMVSSQIDNAHITSFNSGQKFQESRQTSKKASDEIEHIMALAYGGNTYSELEPISGPVIISDNDLEYADSQYQQIWGSWSRKTLDSSNTIKQNKTNRYDGYNEVNHSTEEQPAKRANHIKVGRVESKKKKYQLRGDVKDISQEIRKMKEQVTRLEEILKSGLATVAEMDESAETASARWDKHSEESLVTSDMDVTGYLADEESLNGESEVDNTPVDAQGFTNAPSRLPVSRATVRKAVHHYESLKTIAFLPLMVDLDKRNMFPEEVLRLARDRGHQPDLRL